MNTTVGEGIDAEIGSWKFGGKTAEVFQDHVSKSVPMYHEGHELICKLGDFFIKQDYSRIYDIGTSHGDLLSKLILKNSNKNNCTFIGIDSEADMVAIAKKKLLVYGNITIEHADVTKYNFEKADFIISYYCIQFISPSYRQELISRIYDSLTWGGAFIWFEKVRGSDARFQDIMTSMYNDYKLSQQYSADEILAKERSLRGVMDPFSSAGNMGLLNRAGFTDIMTIFRNLCFEGVLAIK